MRVVNNVEREMIRAEYVYNSRFRVMQLLTITRWENWLEDENMKCRIIQGMLRAGQTTNAFATKKGKKEEAKLIDAREKTKLERMAELQRWHGDYCGDCKLEQEMLEQGRKHIAFGSQ